METIVKCATFAVWHLLHPIAYNHYSTAFLKLFVWVSINVNVLTRTYVHLCQLHVFVLCMLFTIQASIKYSAIHGLPLIPYKTCKIWRFLLIIFILFSSWFINREKYWISAWVVTEFYKINCSSVILSRLLPVHAGIIMYVCILIYISIWNLTSNEV